MDIMYICVESMYISTHIDELRGTLGKIPCTNCCRRYALQRLHRVENLRIRAPLRAQNYYESHSPRSALFPA